jgi:hypothetical protein
MASSFFAPPFVFRWMVNLLNRQMFEQSKKLKCQTEGRGKICQVRPIHIIIAIQIATKGCAATIKFVRSHVYPFTGGPGLAFNIRGRRTRRRACIYTGRRCGKINTQSAEGRILVQIACAPMAALNGRVSDIR